MPLCEPRHSCAEGPEATGPPITLRVAPTLTHQQEIAPGKGCCLRRAGLGQHHSAKGKAVRNLVNIERNPTVIPGSAEIILTVLQLMAAIALYSAEWHWASGLLAGLTVATFLSRRLYALYALLARRGR